MLTINFHKLPQNVDHYIKKNVIHTHTHTHIFTHTHTYLDNQSGKANFAGHFQAHVA